MTATPEVSFDAPVRKNPKKRAKARAAVRKKPSAPFPGLTRTQCATACNAKGCAVSGRSYCAHPTKGGLQPDDMGDRAALKRLQDARDQIDIRLDPDRFK